MLLACSLLQSVGEILLSLRLSGRQYPLVGVYERHLPELEGAS